jgi:hypothetical protein
MTCLTVALLLESPSAVGADCNRRISFPDTAFAAVAKRLANSRSDVYGKVMAFYQ